MHTLTDMLQHQPILSLPSLCYTLLVNLHHLLLPLPLPLPPLFSSSS